jgi:pimeloyl-ACP methyl ester carboxylesterase
MIENNSIIQWGSSGKPIVFLHYFGGSAQSWKWVGEKLKDSFRCISINLPGFGGTPALQAPSIQCYANYVLDQLYLLGVNNYNLIGHSMGGKIAMQLAANAADGSVEQLILIAPSPPSTETISTKEKARMLKMPDRREAENTIAKITKKPLKDDQYALAVQNQLDVDNTTRQWWFLEGTEHSIVNIVKSLHLPITVLASEDDPAIAADVIKKKVISVFGQSKLITTRHAGHLLPMEEPRWVAERIRNIVNHPSINMASVTIKI